MCGVQEYASAPSLDFLDLAKNASFRARKLRVFAGRPQLVSGAIGAFSETPRLSGSAPSLCPRGQCSNPAPNCPRGQCSNPAPNCPRGQSQNAASALPQPTDHAENPGTPSQSKTNPQQPAPYPSRPTEPRTPVRFPSPKPKRQQPSPHPSRPTMPRTPVRLPSPKPKGST